MRKVYSTVIFLLASYFVLGQATITATSTSSNAKWNATSTWDLGRKPTDGDTVIIPSGKSVLFDNSQSYLTLIVKVKGTLNIKGATLAITNAGTESGISVNSGGTINSTSPSSNTSDKITINTVIKFRGDQVYVGNGNSSTAGIVMGPAFADINTGSMNNGFTFGSVLPVILVDFKVDPSNKQVNIAWTTQQEINTSGFAIQRSKDGIHWEVISNILANGYRGMPKTYNYIDNTASAGINYYRLQVIDNNSQFGYTMIRVARIAQVATKMLVYPNPASSFVNIYLGDKLNGTSMDVRLYNHIGQLMLQKKFDGSSNQLTLDVSNLAKGSYLVEISGDGGIKQGSTLLITGK